MAQSNRNQTTIAQLRASLSEEIRKDRQRGASQLARLCLESIMVYAETLAAERTDSSTGEGLTTELIRFADELAQLRPSMTPLDNLMRSYMGRLRNLPASDRNRVQPALRQAQDLIDQSKRAVMRAAIYAADLIKPGETLFTHSISSTIVETFRILSGRSIQAIITESRPGNEGRLLARQLAELKISAEYITEAQAGLFIGKSALVLVGADSILADGSVVNKCGSYLIALAAFDQGVPFYVCCESFKQSAKRPGEIKLEENNGDELELAPLPGVKPRNIYFDITPPKLISGYISEYGVSKQGLAVEGV